MILRDLISRGNSQEYLWTLIVEPGWVQAGIWTIAEGEAQVISVSNPVAWETNEELLNAADTVLSSAVQSLPEDAKEPNKVVFGVPASWVVDGTIKKDRLDHLKTLCSKLTLTPSGFVTLPEAISFYIKSKEGSPLTAVTVSPGREVLEVSVFRLGNLMGTTQVASSVSIFDDVVEGISRFNLADPVPSRFILFDGKEGDLEEARQALVQGAWHEVTKIKLLHTPKIEVLSSEKKIEAVSLGGATEIAKVSTVQLLQTEVKEEAGLGEPTEEDDNVKELGEAREASDLGFVVDDTEPQMVKEEQPVVGTLNTDSPRKSPLAPLILKAKGIINKITNVAGGGKKPLLFGAGAFLFVAVALFAFWWFYPKATVTIFVAPQKLDEKVTIQVSSNNQSVDLGAKTLPGRTVEKTESGEKTTSTTGNKLVGEKAKGEIEIRNGTADSLEIGKDTLLIASNGLEFVLESPATIEAQSSPGSPGVGKVKVVANDIGSEHNLPKDEIFKVGSYPKAEVDGKATGDFTGGASRQIQAIAEEDRERVLDELTAELSEKAKDALKSGASEDEFFIEGSVVATTSNQNYSGKVGDESDNLKLTMDVAVKGVSVSKKDLFTLADAILREKVPSGYILRETQIEYEFELKQFKDNENIYELQGAVSANLLPEINTDDIVKNIVGKYTPLAEEYLSKIPGYARVQITLSPRFPGRLGTLPHVIKNITVEVAADR